MVYSANGGHNVAWEGGVRVPHMPCPLAFFLLDTSQLVHPTDPLSCYTCHTHHCTARYHRHHLLCISHPTCDQRHPARQSGWLRRRRSGCVRAPDEPGSTSLQASRQAGRQHTTEYTGRTRAPVNLAERTDALYATLLLVRCSKPRGRSTDIHAVASAHTCCHNHLDIADKRDRIAVLDDIPIPRPAGHRRLSA